MTPFSHLFIRKNRKVSFQISIMIRELVNIPLVSGYYYINWRIKYASHATGTTIRVPIKDHQVSFSHPISTMVRLVIDKQQILSPCEMKLEVYQKGGKSLGSLIINLSEYAGLGIINEKYLLEDCKFNSIIKVYNIGAYISVYSCILLSY
ncbi:EEIG1/EHBP1 N-terminal domain-containing protein [Pilobolus umbonatus]|nr:EEIG1/EHBP1 N-terminal domain-containing protein [Pilobolus umbonatus]